jgi:Protein of unknown function (DUF2950)
VTVPKTLGLALALVVGLQTLAFAAGQKRFASIDEAVGALVAAIRAEDRNALIDILGPAGRRLVSSGDKVADRQTGARFATDYEKAHHLLAGGGKVVLYVGSDDFPFPIPLVPDGPSWRGDTAAGSQEIVNRRIGNNELSAIQVCLAYVDAQREYYSEDRNGDGILEYAQHLGSTPGKRDGLHWQSRAGEGPSPLGTLVVQARAEGYRLQRGSTGRPPYHGYLYRILTAQGPDAPGGAYDYVVGRHMIGGFALVAFPAQYGASGVMTFVVNHDGIVYERDLGTSTARLATEMKSFNPDRTWRAQASSTARP